MNDRERDAVMVVSMNMRVRTADDGRTRTVDCRDCDLIEESAPARDIREHVRATGHTVCVVTASSVIYRRELTP